MRDGMHGLAMWALSTLMIVVGVGIVSAFASAFEITDESTQAVEELTRVESNQVIIYGFIHASLSLVAAGIAWFAATMGGHHRDNDIDFSDRWSFKR